jgi:hypothetical protein
MRVRPLLRLISLKGTSFASARKVPINRMALESDPGADVFVTLDVQWAATPPMYMLVRLATRPSPSVRSSSGPPFALF